MLDWIENVEGVGEEEERLALSQTLSHVTLAGQADSQRVTILAGDLRLVLDQTET